MLPVLMTTFDTQLYDDIIGHIQMEWVLTGMSYFFKCSHVIYMTKVYGK